MSLHAIVDAPQQGYDRMYIDAATRNMLRRWRSHFLFRNKDNKVYTSQTVFCVITRRSLMYVAKEYLGLEG